MNTNVNSIDIGEYKKKVEIMDQGISRKLDSIEEELIRMRNMRDMREKMDNQRNFEI